MKRWMARHEDGYRRVLDNNEHKIKNSKKWMDGLPAMETDADMLLIIMNIK